MIFKWLFSLFKPRKQTLIVMRVAEMVRVHPFMDTSRKCSKCREKVGIYPSGQAVIHEYGEARVEIICNRCVDAGQVTVAIPAPGALEEMGESVRRGER